MFVKTRKLQISEKKQQVYVSEGMMGMVNRGGYSTTNLGLDTVKALGDSGLGNNVTM